MSKRTMQAAAVAVLSVGALAAVGLAGAARTHHTRPVALARSVATIAPTPTAGLPVATAPVATTVPAPPPTVPTTPPPVPAPPPTVPTVAPSPAPVVAPTIPAGDVQVCSTGGTVPVATVQVHMGYGGTCAVARQIAADHGWTVSTTTAPATVPPVLSPSPPYCVVIGTGGYETYSGSCTGAAEVVARWGGTVEQVAP